MSSKFESLQNPRNYPAIMAALHLRDALKAARQNAYELAKVAPELADFYATSQHEYDRYCGYMGFDPEPVFDREEYEKSDRYQKILSGEIP